MADPLSIAASELAVVIDAIQSIRSLTETVKRFKERDKTLRRLHDELDDFINILNALKEVCQSESLTLVLLRGPISRCSQLCRELENSIKEFSRKSKAGLRNWAKMEFMRGDINEFTDTLIGYKSTISIGLSIITKDISKISYQDIREYKEMLEDTMDRLRNHLQRIDEKLVLLNTETTNTSDASKDPKDQQTVTQECLRICEDVETYIESLTDREPSLRHETPLEYPTAQILTRSALEENQETFFGLIGRLNRRLESVALDAASGGNTERSGLQKKIDTYEQGLELLKTASNGVSSRMTRTRGPDDTTHSSAPQYVEPRCRHRSFLSTYELERHMTNYHLSDQPDEAIKSPDHDYEDQRSLFSDDLSESDTLFSEIRSAGTAESSFSLNLTALDELVDLLLNHVILRPLYEAAIKKVTADKFQTQLHGFFRDYGDRLQQEAETPSQNIVSSFVRRSAKMTATKITLSMQDPSKLFLDFTSLRDEALRIERLNAYLKSLESSSGTVNDPGVIKRQPDQSEEPEDEEPQNLDGVKSFLTSTTAFEVLCRSMEDWVRQNARGPANGDHIGPLGFCTTRRDESNIGRILSTLSRILSSIGALVLTYWRTVMTSAEAIRIFLEPRVPAGRVRLRWRCSCGKSIYGDFDKENPQALSELAKSLQSLGGVHETRHSGRDSNEAAERLSGLTITPNQQSSLTDLSTSRSYSSAQPGDAIFPIESQPRNIDNISRDGIKTQDRSSTLAIQSHAASLRKTYFEFCLNSGEYAVVLDEIDVSSVKTDAEFFEKIWCTYKSMGRNWLRRMFLKPRDIHFVYFGVRHRYQAGIYKEPLEIPPTAEVEAERYHYHECPLEVLPPMPSNVFLHYLSCAQRKAWLGDLPGAHAESFFLQRLPKKVHHSIFDELLTHGTSSGSREIVFGWGVHILEGPNHAMLSLVLGIGVSFSFIVSLMVLSIAGTQEQGFGIGQFLLSIMACVMGALYFKLQGC